MKYLKWIINAFVIIANLILGYIIGLGSVGYSAAFSSERKEEWLLATMVWVVVLIIIDSIYFSVWFFFRRKKIKKEKISGNSS